MSAIPSSNPFPVPGFDGSNNNNASPAEFLKFLRSLIIQYLGDNCPQISENKATWVTIVDGLTDHLLGSFPLPDIVSWNAMEEKVVMTEVTLDVIKRVFLRVDGLNNGSEVLMKKVFARLLDLCRVLDLWKGTEVVCREGVLSPESMKEKAFAVIVSVLRGVDNDSPIVSEHEPSWKTLRSILKECVDLALDLISPTSTLIGTTAVLFFRTPRLVSLKEQNSPDQEPEASPMNIFIESKSQIPSFLVLLVDVLVKTLVPSLKCEWFLGDIVRMTAELSRDCLLYALSPSCATTSAVRTRALMDLLLTTTPLRCMEIYRGIVGEFPHYMLQIRMDSTVKLDWDLMDPFLANMLATEEMHLCKPLVHSVAYRLQTHGSDGYQGLLWGYLRNVLPRLDINQRKSLKQALQSAEASVERTSFLADLASISMPPPTQTNKQPKNTRGRLIIPPHTWRRRLQDLIADIIAPDFVAWMDDDESLSVLQLCQRALFEIRNRFESRSLETWADRRSDLLTKIAELPCLLAQCDQTDCLAINPMNKSLTVGPYIPVLTCLLDGPSEVIAADTRRNVYQAMCKIFRHHNGEEMVDQAVDIVFRGIFDEDRSVRVSAGHALSALIQVYGLQGVQGYQRAETIFVRLYQCFEVAKNAVRETLLVAVGAMGKTKNSDVLGQVLCLLVAQLGRQNPVVKGSACMHILAIAKYCQIAPYKLMHPYMDKIAPYIIKNFPTHPDLLAEACRVMSVAPADFITLTLPRTLPELFATCDQRVLDAATKILSTKASTLLLKHSHIILAHIFLLPSQAATTKALNFVIKLLTDATSSTIDIQSVVKSCVVPLLAELVVVMGDENTEIAKRGIIALKRVEQILMQNKNGTPKGSELGVFLKTYMLGLISDINDMLQDVQGKKSVVMKRKILRSLGALVRKIGPMVNHVSPQIMATFQTMVSIPELSEVTLESWFQFLMTLGSAEQVGPHIGPTTAAIVNAWPSLSVAARDTAFQALEYLICTMGDSLHAYLADIVDLSVIEELQPLVDTLQKTRGAVSPENELQRILKQTSSDNLTVSTQALRELKSFMKYHKDYMLRVTSGDSFDQAVGQIIAALFATACRDNGDGTESLRILSFECIGVLGAMDPDRVEIPNHNSSMVVMKNYADQGEAILFALHLIQDLLVGAFRSTSDIKYQSHLAYSIQELLKFCQFTPALVAAQNITSIAIKVRNRWNALPKHVLETVTPLLEGRFTLNQSSNPDVQHPIYLTQSTYREWIQLWATYLITRVSGHIAQRLFGVFRSAVRNKDVVVAHHLLPHLVLNILISGNENDALDIRTEIITVLNDQIDIESNSTSDKKLLSAQAVFMLLDHLNKWVRIVRQEISEKTKANKNDPKRVVRLDHHTIALQEQLFRLDSILTNIDQSLLAKAAFKCKAFARSLMHFEQHITTLQERKSGDAELPGYYERLHEIYAHLDEPDGMEGMSTMILAPSLEHQIRDHESTGRWTSAQSCWELRLQESPDNVDLHLGLLRCLRNLGHYDTLRTHVAGVLTRHPDWESTLADFQIESAWMVGAWDDVARIAQKIKIDKSSLVVGRLLLAMRSGESKAISESLSHARSILGAPITAAGTKGYRRSYQAVLDLHMLHEIELIYDATSSLHSGTQDGVRRERQRTVADLSKTLSDRLNTTLPTFRIREPLLSMRRTALALLKNPRLGLNREVGKSWLASAKIARKAGQWQTAYSATLQAKQHKASYAFIESAKLIQASGEPLRALHELENSIKYLKLFDENILDLTADTDIDRMKAKILVLRARWMDESDRFDSKPIYTIFEDAIKLQKGWESAQYYIGQFHDDCYKNLSESDKIGRGLKMNGQTVKAFSKSMMHGSKYTYRTVPRLLTIWLDLGENPRIAQEDLYKKMTDDIARAIDGAPVFKWFTAFPQIVSRVGHSNTTIYEHLSRLIITIMQTYPLQSLWLFISVVKSTKIYRSKRGKDILRQLQNGAGNVTNGVAQLVNESLSMTNELLKLCNAPVGDKLFLSMSKSFPHLKALGRSPLIIPLQESLTASLPPEPFTESMHQPFPLDTPTFHDFADEIEVMKSLAKPRKITIRGSNGHIYMFLGKPKDDLRKDARLMEMNSIINKLLKGNSESRRRQLHIRTYGVVALNEDCGFIQWVPNTIAVRSVLMTNYQSINVKSWTPEIHEVTMQIKTMDDERAIALYTSKILSSHAPVFHEWFIETFPEPTAWLASRLTYGRTAAVMSMVGFILGLGDRHGENILLDINSGDVVHVDFNCLFEKGKTLDTPERVPFRLTPNMVDGLGISGVEGVFRTACEVTFQLLRDNKDSLMSVLDAFVHDPLVEWEDEKRKQDRDKDKEKDKGKDKGKGKGKDKDNDKDKDKDKDTGNGKGDGNAVKVEIKDLAKNALLPIEKKLKGMYVPYMKRDRQERMMSTSNLVQLLIQDATDIRNLMRMYGGWMPWH